MLTTADSTRNIQMIQTDNLGNFKLDSMLFFGKSNLLFSDTRGKKNSYIDANLSADSLSKPYFIPDPPITLRGKPFRPINIPVMQSDYDAILQAKGLLLQGVTVKVRKKVRWLNWKRNMQAECFPGMQIKLSIS